MRLDGKCALITGGGAGIGRATALKFAAEGAAVAIGDLRLAAAEETAHLVVKAGGRAVAIAGDVTDEASCEALVRGAEKGLGELDTLINNAGVMAPPTRFETEDGFELQLGTNYLGPFALTNRLLPLLLAAPAGRVTTMSSGMAAVGRIRFDDLQWTRRRYSPTRSYAQSKLADLLLARQLARVSMQRGWALRSNAAHPGFTQTNLQTAGASLGKDAVHRSSIARFPFVPSQLPPEGAEPMLFAAADPRAVEDGYYGPTGPFGLVGPTGPVRLTRRMRDDDTAARLWAVAQDLTGTALPA